MPLAKPEGPSSTKPLTGLATASIVSPKFISIFNAASLGLPATTGLIPFSTVTSTAAGTAGTAVTAPILASTGATACPPGIKDAIIAPAKESTDTVPDNVLAVPHASPNFLETASRFVNASIKEFNSVGSL